MPLCFLERITMDAFNASVEYVGSHPGMLLASLGVGVAIGIATDIYRYFRRK